MPQGGTSNLPGQVAAINFARPGYQKSSNKSHLYKRIKMLYYNSRLINQMVEYKTTNDQLSLTLSALADPTRRAILSKLTLGEATVSELAEPFSMSLPAVSKHIKVLERAGLIARSREAQWRPCRLYPAPIKEVAAWVDEYRRYWEQSLDRLEEYLAELHQKEYKNE
jgi:DNA-binding transcriptional ArsR family regulator